jgi:hypothetical protein
MSDERLADIERRFAGSFPADFPRGAALELVAEIRRLQEVIRELKERAAIGRPVSDQSPS